MSRIPQHLVVRQPVVAQDEIRAHAFSREKRAIERVLDRPDLRVNGFERQIAMTVAQPPGVLAWVPPPMVQILRLSGDDREGCDLDVVASCDQIRPGANDYVWDALVMASFGAGAVRHRQIEIDIGCTGSRFTLPCSATELLVGAYGRGDLAIRLSATYRDAGHPIAPIRSVLSDSVAHGASVTLRIPPMAEIARIHRTPYTCAMSVEWHLRPIGTTLSDGLMGAGVPETIWRVPSGAGEVQITNLDPATEIKRIEIEYELAI